MADFEKKKRSKKKKKSSFLITILLLLIAGSVLFYFGWVQIKLPEKTYAVFFSKTSGYDKKVIRPGKFSWKIEKILPTNSKLIRIKIENQQSTLSFSGSLPSGDLYSSILPNKPDFSYKIQYSFSYSITPEHLPSLISDRLLDPDNLENWYKSIESKINSDIKKICLDFIEENSSLFLNGFINLENKITDNISRKYNFLSINSFTMNLFNFPDLQLYQKARGIYIQIIEKKKETEIASEKLAIELKINLDTELEILSKYGEILSKYPILIEYFALKPESQILEIAPLDYFKKEIKDQE